MPLGVQEPTTVTGLLRAWRAGDEEARNRLIPIVYADLRRVAARQLRGERSDHSFQPTVLVHETFLRLAGTKPRDWADRAHFFRVAAKVMRRILVDHARRRRAAKRGGGDCSIVFDHPIAEHVGRQVELVALEEALVELARIDPRKSEIVEMRFFAGLSIEESATALDLSPATVKRDWTFARTWLFQRLQGTSAAAGAL